MSRCVRDVTCCRSRSSHRTRSSPPTIPSPSRRRVPHAFCSTATCCSARSYERACVCVLCLSTCVSSCSSCLPRPSTVVSSRACDARVIASEREGLHCTSHSSAVSGLHLVRSSPAQPTTLRSGCRLVEDRLTTTPPHTSEPVACRVLRVRVCLLIFWRGAASESSRANVWLCECVLACVRV